MMKNLSRSVTISLVQNNIPVPGMEMPGVSMGLSTLRISFGSYYQATPVPEDINVPGVSISTISFELPTKSSEEIGGIFIDFENKKLNLPDSKPEDLVLKLHPILTTYFSEEDLKTLCLYLNIEYDDLPAQGVSNKARELLKKLKREDKLNNLIEMGQNLRPNAPWPPIS